MLLAGDTWSPLMRLVGPTIREEDRSGVRQEAYRWSSVTLNIQRYPQVDARKVR